MAEHESESADADRPTDPFELALSRLIVARQRAQGAGDAQETQRLAFELVAMLDADPSPPTIARARAVEANFRALEWSYSGRATDEIMMTPGQLRAAQTWLLASRDAPEPQAVMAFERAAQLAHRVADTASDPQDRARGWFLYGNAIGRDWLRATDYPKLETRAQAAAHEQLDQARQAFHNALSLAVGDQEPTLVSRTWTQIAKTWSAELASCDDLRCRAQALQAWRHAIEFSFDDDGVHYRLNFLSTMLATPVLMTQRDAIEARRVLLELNEAAASSQGLAPVVNQVRDKLSDVWEVISGAGMRWPHQGLIIARTPELRRRYLKALVPQLSDYSEARASFLSAGYRLVQAEVEAFRRSDPPADELHALELAADRQRIMLSEVLERDRRLNSAAEGKVFIQEWLSGSLPFLLVLRSFELESRFIDGMDVDPADAIAAPDARTVVMAGARPLNEALSRVEDVPALMIVNPDDAFTYTAAAKLHADPKDWRGLVFALAVEAAVVVVALVVDQDPTRGVGEELAALQAMGATGKTIIILQPRLSGFADPSPLDILAEARLVENLNALGFRTMLNETELTVAPDALADAVRLVRMGGGGAP